MPSYPGPLAVGLLQVPQHTSQAARTRARIALALKAAAEGYALIETFEAGSNGLQEDVAYLALEDLAVQLDAGALVYAGDVDLARVQDVADRARMVLVQADAHREPHEANRKNT
jgi:hypothetical protein